MVNQPTTLLEAVTYFADAQRAHDHFVKVRFPNGVACPRLGCGSASVLHLKSEKRPRFRCKDCKRDFTAKVGTIFEDSALSLSKWLPAVWMIANCKNGISSCEVARALGVTQKTAWFMLHRIRVAMSLRSFEKTPLSGEIEADETFVGGRTKATNRTKTGELKLAHGPATGKTTVFGMLERGRRSRVRAMVVPDHKRSSLLPHIKANVSPGSFLYTDALRSYRNLGDEYQHAWVDHMIEYVNGTITTNRIENFWACLKRTIKGTYICPRPFHLESYVEEQVFRFNERFGDDADRFFTATRGADGKRLTYTMLKAQNATRH
jgi:transposase-like protein